MSETRETVTPGSGNVFADLGFDHPEDELAKAELVRRIRMIINKRHMTQTEAGKLLGLKQPDVSALVNGRLAGFSLERLMAFLTRLDRDVQIVVKKKPRTRAARLSVAGT